MSDKLAGIDESYMAGYKRGLDAARALILFEANDALFSVHKFANEIAILLQADINKAEIKNG